MTQALFNLYRELQKDAISMHCSAFVLKHLLAGKEPREAVDLAAAETRDIEITDKLNILSDRPLQFDEIAPIYLQIVKTLFTRVIESASDALGVKS